MKKYKFENLAEFASKILIKAGLAYEKAKTVGELLVTADAMGHKTHGLAFLPIYIRALKQGVMKQDGEPDILKDKGPILDIKNPVRLPGASAMKGLMEAKQNGLELSIEELASLEEIAKEFDLLLPKNIEKSSS